MSVSLKFSKSKSFVSSIDQWMGKVRDGAEGAAKGLAKTLLHRLTMESPQYSGTFAANWRVSVGSPDTTYDQNPLGGKGSKSPDYARGSQPAVHHAEQQLSRLSGFKLGQTIFISNSTLGKNEVKRDGFYATMFHPLAWKIEEGVIKLRPVNAGADHVAARSMVFVSNRFATINAGKLALLTRGLGA